MIKQIRQFLAKFPGQRFVLLIVATILIIMALSLPRVPAIATIDQAIVKEIIDGDQVFIETNQAKVDDNATLGQVISTKQSRAGVTFSNGAAGRMGPDSLVTVGQCVELKQGQIVVSGPANGCISGFLIGVKGTVYTVEADQKNSQETANIKVLEGTVSVKKQDETDPTKSIEIPEGKKVSIDKKNELGSVLPIPTEELVRLLSGPLFNGFNIPITPEGVLSSICRKLVPQDLFECSSSGIPKPRIPSVPSVPSVPSLPF